MDDRDHLMYSQIKIEELQKQSYVILKLTTCEEDPSNET
jgi:hypothetical protein